MNKVPDELIIDNQEEIKSASKQSDKKNKKKHFKMDKQLIITIICCLITLSLFGVYAYKKLNGPLYTITFNSDGGTKISSQKIRKNKLAKIPNNPTKANYIFIRWEYNNKEYRFDEKVTKNITLKAIWQEDESNKSYMVLFDSNGGSSTPSQTIKNGAKIEKPQDPTKEHATFKFWTNNGDEYDFNTSVYEDMFLVAEWINEEKVYVSFDSDGGTDVQKQELYINERATKPANPTKKDYKFIEWQLDDATFDFNTPITRSIILKAKWEKVKTYIVKFDDDGYLTETIVPENNKVQPITPRPKEGYKCVGWLLDGQPFDFNTPITKDIVLKPNWVEN